MNVKFLASIIVFSCCASLYGEDPSITAAIKSSNVEELGKLLMTGTYVRLQDKKCYSVLAQQKTKDAYLHLHAFSSADVKHSIAAVFKFGGAAYLGWLFYLHGSIVVEEGKNTIEQESNDVPQPTSIFGNVQNSVASKLFSEPTDALSKLFEIIKDELPIFALCSGALYAGYQGMNDIRAIIQKDDRARRYIQALAIEGLIARVPVFEQ